MVNLTQNVARELAPKKVRVNAISPGPVQTPMHDHAGLVGVALDALVAQIPLGRRGQPNEVASAVVFLASDEGAFTVGSEFVIDGGMSNL